MHHELRCPEPVELLQTFRAEAESLAWTTRVRAAAPFTTPVRSLVTPAATKCRCGFTMRVLRCAARRFWAPWGKGCVTNAGAKPSGLCSSSGPWANPFLPEAVPEAEKARGQEQKKNCNFLLFLFFLSFLSFLCFLSCFFPPLSSPF